jgi:hypothetical protein
MQQKKIVLKPFQKLKFDKLIDQARFDRLANEIINNKKYTVDERAKLVLKLKYKIFG